MDFRFEDPLSSPIIHIKKKYFGDILKFTPFILGGVNFNGIIKFDDRKEEETFDKQFGIDRTIAGLIIYPNSTSADCTSAQQGAIYFNNVTFKHFGCNSTDWNALY